MEENTAIEVVQVDGEIVVDSRIIAKGVGVTHKAFMETLRTYQSELEEFGSVRFETAPKTGKTAKVGGDQPKYAMLNRNQTGIAISFSRNTKQVVRFKVDLFHRIDELEQTIARQQQALAGLYQQPAPAQLPPPLFASRRETFLTVPTFEPEQAQVEAALIKTVELLQPHYPQGVSCSLLAKYDENIQAYMGIYGAGGILAISESLVALGILTRSEVNGAYFYSIPPVAGYLQAPEQGEA